MTVEAEQAPSLWGDAVLAAAMIAVDRHGLGGVHVRARAGPVRDRWVNYLLDLIGAASPVRRIAAGISEARLGGGLDIGATLEAGRPVAEQGVLAAADDGFVILSMAERSGASAAGIIGMALDTGVVRVERDGISAQQPARFALIALDEGIDADEALTPALADRLGLRIDLNTVCWREAELPIGQDTKAVEEARALLPNVLVADDMAEALCGLALSVGAGSLRSSLFLVRAARVAAALAGREIVGVDDAATALRLVLGVQPAAAQEPREEREEAPQEQRDKPGEDRESEGKSSSEALQDMLVEAVEAALPKNMLASLGSGAARRGAKGSAGKAGDSRERAKRGRAVGIADKPPTPGARIDVLATLRQAAPWQRIRQQRATAAAAPSRLQIRKDDFRYIRYREKTGTTAVFAVDASGSAAVERLAETKGAIEILLAECYVRRDSVALIAFRGRSAETLLEPTRSLVRAKRCLSALPGGGGTPLAGGILAALAMATGAARKGQSVVTVFLTDGRGNVALDGTSGRERVGEDAMKVTRLFRAAALRSIVIDTGQRPQARAQALARDLGAEYLALPRGGARTIAQEIGARMET